MSTNTASTARTEIEQVLRGSWSLDPAQSALRFRIRKFFWHPGGRFETLRGRLDASEAGDVSVGFTVEAASIRTGPRLRDAHLRTRHFLDARRHRLITFQSTSVEPSGSRLLVRGDLTIKGTTRPLELAVALELGDSEVRLRASGQIDRRAFGVVAPAYVEMGGLMLGKRVEFELDARLGREGTGHGG